LYFSTPQPDSVWEWGGVGGGG